MIAKGLQEGTIYALNYQPVYVTSQCISLTAGHQRVEMGVALFSTIPSDPLVKFLGFAPQTLGSVDLEKNPKGEMCPPGNIAVGF